MPEELTEHLPTCDIATYELCTCGLGARQREIELARSNARVQEIIRERERVYDRSVRKHRIGRIGARLVFFGILYLVGQWSPWIAGIVFALWLTGSGLMWLIEGLPGGDAQPGLGGCLRFLFW